MTEQSTAQKINVGLAELVGLMNGPAWPGRQHRTGIIIAELAAAWNEHRHKELVAQFEAEYNDEIADIAAHDDELDQQNALRRGEG